MLELHWDTLDAQTKEEILSNACINERFQHYEWGELDNWLKLLILENFERRSRSTSTIIA